ncbi:thiL thiamine monophosphate kinase [Pyrococcus abyssi GE5]|uniref:Thiamine-monophosphate kinase n=2 Tax=Pyrococcus abyssi TaxID=29292 RepID=THIL_PYRAB|nr:RecName: Full=Thiamine-monophosphate kinase; Short=TMP kinase; Short=Thiamine-phosphate kinase [Pyrococcus abyssi GE5]CAB49311.1 thiL thiamine monophosphate kinase [Pyrococcus abyssi GE5]CCE69767.1 TPA: thiamine monophosphate kinase [Pyrococcus abyssi GE5]
MVVSMREGEIISLFMKHFERHSLGDDAGFIKLNNSWLLVTSDMLVWKTDVPDFMTPEDAGRKVVTMNVSDIAAMGGRPMAFFFSLAVPGDVSEDILRGIARGINEGSKVYKLKIVSGDTNEADDIIIDGGSLGIGKRLLLRSNAKPGDLVCVTGDLGRPLTALLLWMRGEKIPREIEEKARNPRARVEEGVKLSSLANSAIDISDGLSKELWEIANASNVRIIIEEERLPISDSVKEIVSDPVKVALASGEEFELLFTIPREKVEELDIDFKIIGRVEGGNGVYIKRGRKIEELEVLGWEHLAGGIDVEL